MSITKVQAEINEHVLLKKYHGDGPEDRTDTPAEVIEVHNGIITKHIIDGIEIPLE